MSEIKMRSFDDEDASDGDALAIEMVQDVTVGITVEIARTEMTVGDLLKKGRGSVIDLYRKVGEPVDILVNGKPLARGELVINADNELAVTLTEIHGRRR
jgi:flagellar motor switch protein FliN/FliY